MAAARDSCVDPIEKKPLNHFLPGTSVLSFGTAGCNLGCKFCQNWDISKSREVERLSEAATPETIARAARQLGCHSVAFTYNDPVIWAEYAIDTARACRAAGVKTVAVTAGYISPAARSPFFAEIDAANVDLKAFTEDFYQRITYSHLEPVLETLRWLKHESDVWFEITNLLIPEANDSPDELQRLCDWVLQNLGDEVPLHYTAFHPDFRMKDRPATPHETLLKAYEIARSQGLKYVYVGNVSDTQHDSTYCPHCGKLVIERNWHELGAYHLRDNHCRFCGGTIAGRFEATRGNWGRQRMPVRIAQFAETTDEQEDSTVTNPSNPTAIRPPAGFTSHQPPQLSDEQRRSLHQAVCRLLADETCGKAAQLADVELSGAGKLTVMGAFVTLKRHGRLRACCGTLGQPFALADAVGQAAKRTATQDVRLPPVSPSELPYLDVGISLLHSFQNVSGDGRQRIDQIKVGDHGLHIHRGDQSGLLLPNVATENELGAEAFLRQVCRKAGLPSLAWEDSATQLQTFEVGYVDGPFDQSVAEESAIQPSLPFGAEEFETLAAHCRANILAHLRGATPSYYLPGISDGTFPGVALSLTWPEGDPLRLVKFAMRPGVPLQATLHDLTALAAQTLQAHGASEQQVAAMPVGLAVFSDAAMHGTVAEADLRGIEPKRRAVLVMESNKTAWAFAPQESPQRLLEIAAAEAQVGAPNLAGVFSVAVQTNEPALTISTAPRPQTGDAVRPAAVAGSFYPADANDLKRMLDDLLDSSGVQAQPWPALMVPHAGLVYSGKIAAQTLQRVKIPDTVIVIGPKHTRLGVQWAVTPHETWSLPTGDVACDAGLARRLAAAIPGLELDAAAHRNEHAIEVELPLLARLAPQARVVGIALGAGDLHRSRAFAESLADCLQQEAKMPLLIVSSDMNHFASDKMNRRLDEMALTALETLDPEIAYNTVTGHHISMCGILPAIVVLETLRRLGKLKRCERVAYGTSADVSGDTSRVVGYAGMLFGDVA